MVAFVGRWLLLRGGRWLRFDCKICWYNPKSQKYQTFEKTVFERIVKLGYNNHSYNSLPVIMNRKLLSLGLIPHILGYEFTG
jgi:hypothetical protein